MVLVARPGDWFVPVSPTHEDRIRFAILSTAKTATIVANRGRKMQFFTRPGFSAEGQDAAQYRTAERGNVKTKEGILASPLSIRPKRAGRWDRGSLLKVRTPRKVYEFKAGESRVW
jgi:hypothetical protein